MHNILFTNDKLFKFKLLDSPLCTFCKTTEESINHLFFYCQETRALWRNLIDKLGTIHRNQDGATWEMVTLLGCGISAKHKEGLLVDFILNIYKLVIWNNRCARQVNDYNVNLNIIYHNTVKKKINLIFHMFLKNNSLEQFFLIFAHGGVLLSKATDNSFLHCLDS